MTKYFAGNGSVECSNTTIVGWRELSSVSMAHYARPYYAYALRELNDETWIRGSIVSFTELKVVLLD